MNKNVIITSNAKQDITDIVEYIGADNNIVAKSIIVLFSKTFDLLGEYPHIGAIKSELGKGKIRIHTVKKNFSIVYTLTNDNKVVVLRVLTKYQNIFAVL